MMKAIKGFSVHVEGREKAFPAGADVPDEMAEEFGLARKGLVERGTEGSLGPAEVSRKSTKTTE